MIELQILSGVKAGNSIKSDLSTILIGREPECTLQLDPYQDLLVHGQHAKIYFSEGHYYLEDLNTKNGTYFNEQSIKEPVKLDTGTKFRLGDGGPEIQVESWDNLLENKLVAAPTLFQLVRKENNETHSFSQISVRIGRQPECELSLDPLKERQVSGYHAVIRQEKDGCYLEDLGSANGTFINNTLCKREKLENGNIIRLGTDGPEFEFVLSKAPTAVAKQKVKRFRKRKKNFDKKSEIPDKHLWIAVGLVLFLLFFILIVSSGPSETAKTAINRQRSNVVFLYCRYLVDIGDTTIRMQRYGCGVLRRVGEQTAILTPDINIFPWKYAKEKGPIKIRSHFVAAWSYNSISLIKSIAIPYQRLEFVNSFNNDFERLGGNGQLILPKQPDNENPSICEIKIKDKFNSILNPTPWSPSTKISNNKVYCISYLHPLNTISKDGKVPITLFEGLWKNSTISFPNAITGAPMLNAQGELLGLFYAKTKTKGTYILIP